MINPIESAEIDFDRRIYRIKDMERELDMFCEFKEAGYVLNPEGVWDLPREQEINQ